jgi:hypothetical protein
MFMIEDKNVYINYLGNTAVFTPNKEVFGNLKAFIEDPLSKYTVSNEAEVIVSVNNLTNIFKNEIDALREQVKGLTSNQMAEQLFPGMKDIVEKEIQMIYDFVMAVDTVSLSAAATSDRIQAILRIKPKSGTRFEEQVKGLSSSKFALAGRLPKETYGAVLININVGVFKNLTKIGVDMLTSALKFTEEEKTKFAQSIDKLMDLQTGEYDFALHSQAPAVVALTYIEGNKNGMESRQVAYEMLDMILSKGIGYIKEMAQKDGKPLPPELAQIDAKTVKDLLALGIKMVQEKMPGLTIQTESLPYNNGMLDYITVTLDYEKLGIGSPEKDVINKLFGNTFSAVLGYGQDVTLFVLGPKAVDQAKAILDGKSGFDENIAWTATKKVLAQNSTFALYIAPGDIIKAIQEVPELAKFKEKMAALSSDEAYSLSVGGKDSLEVVLDIPLKTSVELFKLFMEMKMAKKEEAPQPKDLGLPKDNPEPVKEPVTP